MIKHIPTSIDIMVQQADISWQPVLRAGLEAMASAAPAYLSQLAADVFLPNQQRMFAAFTQPLAAVRYVLVGEGPYPREQSATGVCFMDGAVQELWSEKGLSKSVNRATSLRNFMKMLLVAEGKIAVEQTSGDALAPVALEANVADSALIHTLSQLQANLIAKGFLLLNATLVFRPDVPPLKEARAWQPFLHTVLHALLMHAKSRAVPPPALILWGKIAEQLDTVAATAGFPKVISEHPYNLTFIANPAMQQLFAPMRLLYR